MKNLIEILNALGSETPFSKDAPRIADIKPPFTVKGLIAYEKLTDILYSVGEITSTDMNDVIDELDEIVNAIEVD